jgi:transposase
VTKIVCGVDVSKGRLDAHVVPSGAFESFDNDVGGIAALADFCRRHGVQLVAMEATGGFERQAFLLLWQAGIACGRTNPRSVRRYAEAMGILEKTDRLDASVIARFAIAKELKPTEPPTPLQQRLNALVARLRQVTEDLTVQKQRRSCALNEEMVMSIDEVIALLKRQAKALAGEIGSLIDDDPLWSRLDAALRTKGVADRAVA